MAGGRNHGKWSQPNVPHKGWICVDVEDLGSPDSVCEMCEIQEIRYVHHMQHSDFAGDLGVGCVCAEYMEGDYVAPRRRESVLRNAAQRKRRWLVRKWRVSANGNFFLNADGFNVTIYKKANGKWGGRLEDRESGNAHLSRKEYPTEDTAKLAAFDGMIFLKNERGWGS